MAAIDDDAHALESQGLGERRLGLLDVATHGVVDAHRLADLAGRGPEGLDAAAEDQFLDLVLGVVVQLVPVGPEELDAVVVVGIV